MWKILSNVLPSKKQISKISISASSFNDYFSTIGTNIINKIDTVDSTDDYIGEIPYTFDFYEINVNNVLQQLLKLSHKSSQDLLGFDCNLLRISSLVIAPLLTHIYNLSIATGVVPNDFKFAKVTPGSKSDPGSYRPISVISTPAKLLESIVKRQIVNYFTDNELFTSAQSGYMKHHSTSTILHDLIDTWLDNMENGQTNIVSYLDLIKGFDTISHDLLLNKLEKYGISQNNLKWFKSYLTDRFQFVTCNNNSSSLKPLSVGVPQGSILHPILFLIFVNDLPNCFKNSKASLYADDSTLTCTGKTVDEIQNNMQVALDSALKLFKENKLIVNLSKTKMMLIGTNYKTKQLSDISVTVNNIELIKCDTAKLLGIFIDQNLTWDSHIEYLHSVIAPKIGLIHRLRQFLPLSALNTIYIYQLFSLSLIIV